jgi:hypothetical protein
MHAAWVNGGAGVPALEPGQALARWLREPLAGRVSRCLFEAWRWRDDLRAAFPDPLGEHAAALAAWGWHSGVREGAVHPVVLQPVPHPSCRLPGGPAWDEAIDLLLRETPAKGDGFAAGGSRALRRWLRSPGTHQYLTRYLEAVWQCRADLRAAYPRGLADQAGELTNWAWSDGTKQGLAAALLPDGTPLRRLRRTGAAAAPTISQAAQRARDGARTLGRRAGAVLGELIDRRAPLSTPGERERLEQRLLETAVRARSRYRAEPWAGPVVVIRNREWADRPSFAAWRYVAPAARHELLEADHFAMLREPGAPELAQCLERAIANALQ